jgi:hypothetical protein
MYICCCAKIEDKKSVRKVFSQKWRRIKLIPDGIANHFRSRVIWFNFLDDSIFLSSE